jgi:hypothetical protein
MPPCCVSWGFVKKAKLPFSCISKKALLVRVYDRKMLLHGTHANTRSLLEFEKRFTFLARNLRFMRCILLMIANFKWILKL